MNKKRLGKVLVIISIVLLLTGWYFNHFIWGIILYLPFNMLFSELFNEIYLSYCLSMMLIYFLMGYLGIRLWLGENKLD